MENTQAAPALSRPLTVEDQALFQRVWRRVMPDDENSPIALGPAVPAAPPAEQQADQPPAPLPQAEMEPEDVPCLGRSSLEYAPLLRELMEGVHSLALSYQGLARRSQGHGARQLSALGADQQRQGRQLGAVYFLLTAQRFRPSAPASLPAGPVSAALRALFAQEQRLGRRYLQSAQTVRDPCLSGLFRELEGETALHLDSIRHILEGMP